LQNGKAIKLAETWRILMPMILTSQKAIDNIRDLTSDPIVLGMHLDLVKANISASDEHLGPNWWEFISACNRRYEALGGRNAHFIGAVAGALISLEQG